MRRISPRKGLAVCVALSALTFTAACSGDASSDAAAPAAVPATGASAVPPAPVDPSVAAAADAALSADTKQICAQAERATVSFGELFVADMKLKIDAAADGTAAKQQADKKIARDVENFSFALADMAGLTTDAPLKKALTAMSAEVKALKGDVAKLDTDRMAGLTAKLDKACGKA
ncbi:hypothetical protein [Paractinoplanes lichenicola]|uniref:Lipoprotein n=1 Tax=Paractinoplanes lichenicola TaxID=2802976 RepID=A0ABS1VN63_9ACTN|nr:hypothetical protein [Actinoplanes lichenicola]MBL7256083.1 hypothetical protein [Actinoplanes lichenicola]